MPRRPLLERLAPLLIVLASLACATKDARWVNENLELSENFHAGTMILETPLIPNTGAHRARLRATGRTRGPRRGAEIELAVRAEFEDFSFLDRVSFASGRAYPLTVVKRENEDCGTTDISLCNVHEDVSVRLSRKFLISKRATGFHAKLWGRRESVVLFVPPEYIEGLISKMEHREPISIESLRSTNSGPIPAAPDPANPIRH